MKSEEIKLLADIFADPELVTPEEIDNELKDFGFNYDEFRTLVLNKIMDLKREALYDEGSKKINRYHSILSGLKEKLQTQGADAELEKQIRFAFNKLDELTEEDIAGIIKDQKKMLLLKDIMNKKDTEE